MSVQVAARNARGKAWLGSTGNRVGERGGLAAGGRRVRAAQHREALADASQILHDRQAAEQAGRIGPQLPLVPLERPREVSQRLLVPAQRGERLADPDKWNEPVGSSARPSRWRASASSHRPIRPSTVAS